MKAPDFGRLIRHHGRGARWQVPTAYDGQWWHLHRPDGAQRTGLWRSADSASLLEGDPGDPVVVGDGREVEVVQFLTGGSSAAVVVRPAGGERLEMWWLKGGERRWGEVVVSGVSPWAKPVLDEWGRVVCCPEVSDGRRRQVLRWSGAGPSGVVLSVRGAEGTSVYRVQVADRDGVGVAEPVGAAVVSAPASRAVVATAGMLLQVGDGEVVEVGGDGRWLLPSGRLLGVVGVRGADGDADGDGRLLAAVRREGCAALVPLMPEGAPAEPWWVGALGVELGSVGVTGDSQVWWVTRSAGAPSQMHRRIWDAATTTGVEMATVGSVSQRCRHVRAEAVGPDGTAIPYVVTDDPAWRSGSARPVLLTVYGGFGVEHWPEAEPTVAAWVQAGGVVVTAQVRGGGEFGPQWHEAGSGEWKGRAAVDVLTVARALVDRGVTCPGGVMLCGASHGGLVAASAALLDDGDPAVVGGVAVTAPLLDVTDVSRHGNGQFWAAEFPAGRAARAAVSPLWLVRQGDRRLPPLWVASMGRDERVADDAADFVAAWARRGEVTHRREEESAHVGDRLAQIDARSADLLGFAWRAASAAVMG